VTPLDPRTTALVLIDLQNGILSMPIAPRGGAEVLAAGKELARRFRAAGAPVVLVRVGWSGDGRDALSQPVDQPRPTPPGGYPAGWSELADGLSGPADITILKRQWGAFHGTELDLQLRRRGVSTIVLGGVATNFGVESTARQAWELGYAIILAEDVTASASADMHQFSIDRIMPRIARISPSDALTFDPVKEP
jgi:nicotinamidase-related amidase